MSEFLRHTILQGETLQELSQRYLNDVSRWVDLVVLNDLEHPFIVDRLRVAGETSVKGVGDILLIPINDQTLEGLHRHEIREEYERLLGEDLSLFVDDGNIALTEEAEGELDADDKGGLKTVKGLANLRQALLIRLSTPQGSLLYHPTFGTTVYVYIGQRDTYENNQKIRIELERCVREDQRVTDVTFDEFVYSDGVLNVKMRVRAIGVDEMLEMGLLFREGGVIEWG